MNEQGKLMRWIVASSLRYRWLVVFAGAALIAFGVSESGKASVDVYQQRAAGRGADHDPTGGAAKRD